MKNFALFNLFSAIFLRMQNKNVAKMQKRRAVFKFIKRLSFEFYSGKDCRGRRSRFRRNGAIAEPRKACLLRSETEQQAAQSI